MKKLKNMLLALTIFFLGTTMTYAEDNFKKIWETEEYEVRLEESVNYYNSIGAKFKDGYIVTNIEDEDGTYITFINYYDENGNLIKKYPIEEFAFLDLIVKDDTIYGLIEDFGEYGLIKLNSDFEIEAALYLGDDEQEDFDVQEAFDVMKDEEVYTWGIEFFTLVDDELAIFPINGKILVVDSDLTGYTTLDYNEENCKKYFTEIYKIINVNSEYGINSYNYAKNDNNEYYFGGYDDIAIIKMFDNNGTEKWTKEFEDYTNFGESKIIDNYIVTEGIKPTGDYYTSDILILDLEGNIIQKIENDNIYTFLRPTERGFVITDYKFEDNLVTTHSEVYQLPWNITQKIEGKGTIEVIESEMAGAPVTFVVKPEEGYVLGEVKVTDAAGNVVTFTDYTFTMPSADVTIEATFIKEEKNPETVDTITICFIIIMFVGGIGTFLNFKRTSLK